MYRFKYYYKDGTEEVSGGSGSRPEVLYEDFDGLMDWDEFDSLSSKNLNTHEILEKAMKVYKGHLKDYYRIEIINDDNEEVIDYIDEREEKLNG